MSNKNNKILFKGQQLSANDPESKDQRSEDPVESGEKAFRLRKRFLRYVKTKPFHCLWLVFDASTLGELRNIWNNWVQCALCAPYSAFSENSDRRFLLWFDENFWILMEALHEVTVQQTKKKGKKLFYTDPDLRYGCLHDKDNVYQRITDFTLRYSQKKTLAYLWFVFECALEEGEAFMIDRKNLLFDFECLLCIAKTPYQLFKHYRAQVVMSGREVNSG